MGEDRRRVLKRHSYLFLNFLVKHKISSTSKFVFILIAIFAGEDWQTLSILLNGLDNLMAVCSKALLFNDS